MEFEIEELISPGKTSSKFSIIELSAVHMLSKEMGDREKGATGSGREGRDWGFHGIEGNRQD